MAGRIYGAIGVLRLAARWGVRHRRYSSAMHRKYALPCLARGLKPRDIVLDVVLVRLGPVELRIFVKLIFVKLVCPRSERVVRLLKSITHKSRTALRIKAPLLRLG